MQTETREQTAYRLQEELLMGTNTQRLQELEKLESDHTAVTENIKHLLDVLHTVGEKMKQHCEPDVLNSVEQKRLIQTQRWMTSRIMHHRHLQQKKETTTLTSAAYGSIGFISNNEDNNDDSEAAIIDSKVQRGCALLKSCVTPYITTSDDGSLEPHHDLEANRRNGSLHFETLRRRRSRFTKGQKIALSVCFFPYGLASWAF